MQELELIQKFGEIFEYLNELSGEGVLFYSDQLLPASKAEIEKAALMLSGLTMDQEELSRLQAVALLLEHFISHGDALRMAQLARKIGRTEELLNENGSTSAVKKEYLELMNKYTSTWT